MGYWKNLLNTHRGTTFKVPKYITTVSTKIQVGYSKLVANIVKSITFSDHSVLYLSWLYPILRNKDFSDIWVAYFRFCEYLLYLPLWYGNRKLINKFHLIMTFHYNYLFIVIVVYLFWWLLFFCVCNVIVDFCLCLLHYLYFYVSRL